MTGVPRVALIVLRRRDGAYFVHQRHTDKRVYPGLFGLGAGGRVEPTEDPATAATRELFEETGIEAEPVARFDFDFGGQRHVHVFECTTDVEPRHCEREWQWSGWLEGTEVEALRQQGKLCPDTAQAWDWLRRGG